MYGTLGWFDGCMWSNQRPLHNMIKPKLGECGFLLQKG